MNGERQNGPPDSNEQKKLRDGARDDFLVQLFDVLTRTEHILQFSATGTRKIVEIINARLIVANLRAGTLDTKAAMEKIGREMRSQLDDPGSEVSRFLAEQSKKFIARLDAENSSLMQKVRSDSTAPALVSQRIKDFETSAIHAAAIELLALYTRAEGKA